MQLSGSHVSHLGKPETEEEHKPDEPETTLSVISDLVTVGRFFSSGWQAGRVQGEQGSSTTYNQVVSPAQLGCNLPASASSSASWASHNHPERRDKNEVS